MGWKKGVQLRRKKQHIFHGISDYAFCSSDEEVFRLLNLLRSIFKRHLIVHAVFFSFRIKNSMRQHNRFNADQIMFVFQLVDSFEFFFYTPVYLCTHGDFEPDSNQSSLFINQTKTKIS